MASPVDYNGLAVLVTAITGLVAGVGTILLQALSLSRQAQNKASQDAQLNSLHDCVHEAGEKVQATISAKTEEIKQTVSDAGTKS